MNRSFPEVFNPFTTTLTDLFIFSINSIQATCLRKCFFSTLYL